MMFFDQLQFIFFILSGTLYLQLVVYYNALDEVYMDVTYKRGIEYKLCHCHQDRVASVKPIARNLRLKSINNCLLHQRNRRYASAIDKILIMCLTFSSFRRSEPFDREMRRMRINSKFSLDI